MRRASTLCVVCSVWRVAQASDRMQTPPPGPMLKASGMYRRSRRLCGQGRRRHEEGVVDIRESPLTEARRGAERLWGGEKAPDGVHGVEV